MIRDVETVQDPGLVAGNVPPIGNHPLLVLCWRHVTSKVQSWSQICYGHPYASAKLLPSLSLHSTPSPFLAPLALALASLYCLNTD